MKPLLLGVVMCLLTGIAYAQTVSCSVSTPLGATPRAVATGHTEPIAAGPNAIPPTPGGGAVRVTCSASGSPVTAGVATLTVSLGVPITNTITHPSPTTGIRVIAGTVALVTDSIPNVTISSIN